MHHLELNMSSIQQLWYLGTAKKPGEIFKAHISLCMCHVASLRWSIFFSLPVKESQMFRAPRNIPLAQLNQGSQCFTCRFHLCLEVCFCSFRWYYGRFINQTYFPSISQPALHLHKCDSVVVSLVLKCINRQENELNDSRQSTDTSGFDAGSFSLQNIPYLPDLIF